MFGISSDASEYWFSFQKDEFLVLSQSAESVGEERVTLGLMSAATSMTSVVR